MASLNSTSPAHSEARIINPILEHDPVETLGRVRSILEFVAIATTDEVMTNDEARNGHGFILEACSAALLYAEGQLKGDAA